VRLLENMRIFGKTKKKDNAIQEAVEKANDQWNQYLS